MAGFVLPWWIHNQATHGANSVARCFDFALYNRAANVERGTGATNEQLAEIQGVVAAAKAEGRIPADADEGMAWTVWQAYREVNGSSLKNSSEMLGQAAVEKLWADPLSIAWGTVKYSGWMLLTPDSSYRYQPGGAQGVAGRRPPDAEIFDSAMYLGPLQSPLSQYADYLTLESGPTSTTSMWTAVNRFFYRHVENAPPILGVGDTLYEEIILLCTAAGLLSWFSRERLAWGIVSAVIALQIIPSALVAGIGPRYAVPVQPLLNLFAALTLTFVLQAVCRATRWARDLWATPLGVSPA